MAKFLIFMLILSSGITAGYFVSLFGMVVVVIIWANIVLRNIINKNISPFTAYFTVFIVSLMATFIMIDVYSVIQAEESGFFELLKDSFLR